MTPAVCALALFAAAAPGPGEDRSVERFPFLLATSTTRYDPGDADRAWNLALAASRLDGIVLSPGEPLSFNERVGPRGIEEGFRPAPEIVGGERIPGIGGGVCQVASTLYSAALDAGLAIRARAPHSRPVPYSPPGRDATVSSEREIDLRIANDTPVAVAVRARAAGGRLVVEMRAAADPGFRTSVRIESAPAPPASEAAAAPVDGSGPVRPAIEVTVVRTRLEAGGAETRDVVARDLYLPSAQR